MTLKRIFLNLMVQQQNTPVAGNSRLNWDVLSPGPWSSIKSGKQQERAVPDKNNWNARYRSQGNMLLGCHPQMYLESCSKYCSFVHMNIAHLPVEWFWHVSLSFRIIVRKGKLQLFCYYGSYFSRTTYDGWHHWRQFFHITADNTHSTRHDISIEVVSNERWISALFIAFAIACLVPAAHVL